MKLLASNFRNCRGGILFKFAGFILVLAATFALMWILLLPSLVTGLIKKRTGFGATVQSLYVDPFTGTVNITQLKITNPDTFPKKDFVSVNQFKTSVEPGSLFSDRIVVKDAIFDVAYISMVKNAEGQTNINVFEAGVSPGQKSPGQENEPQSATPAEKKPPKQFLIRHLVVKLDKLVIADYSRSQPEVREIPLKINRTFADVTNLTQISAPLIADLTVAGVGKLAGNILGLVIPAPILQSLGVVTKDAGSLLQQTGKKTTNFFKGLFDSLEEKPKQ
jgi:hypothetical protein